MVLYTSVKAEASAEQIIEKSRFIAHIKPVLCREEAEVFIAEIKGRYKDATHNVPAFVIGDKMQLQWASDDGEPQGTSGAPIVKMLVNQGLTNVCIVVTRYFGGIKLGTGGLVRAYTSSAKLAVDAAGLLEVRDIRNIEFKLDYGNLAKLQNLEKSIPFNIENIEYADVLKVKISFEPENAGQLSAALRDITKGEVSLDI